MKPRPLTWQQEELQGHQVVNNKRQYIQTWNKCHLSNRRQFTKQHNKEGFCLSRAGKLPLGR
ncbi:hypothetical protein CCACVL1_25340 [Corchorus capsularis]|uniref:Uncharacterized protein n=1 Tax=Corchorus capsularis TaxID=210143 RepID=A0A1R3GL74_COCAP|nr:hypothetical protein CCACVL1_25340 [Corchorus capsularis]